MCVISNVIVSNCALVWHYQVIRLYNGVYCIMVFVMHLSLIIRALSNCQNFNLGQANLPLMIQIGNENTTKWWIKQYLGYINFATVSFLHFFYSSQCWHPMWQTFATASVKKSKCAKTVRVEILLKFKTICTENIDCYTWIL